MEKLYKYVPSQIENLVGMKKCTTFSFGNHETCLVAKISRNVVVVVALVLARLQQAERLVSLLDVVAAAALGVVPPTAATVAFLVVVGVVGEEVAVDAR